MTGAIDQFDKLQLYFGLDYTVNEKIVLHQPTIGEIVEMGEMRYYSMVQTICSIPSDRKSALWDIGIDYEKISDFEYFRLLITNIPQSETQIIFGNIDFTKFQPGINKQNDEPVLFDLENGIVIDEYIYLKIVSYMRKLHGIKPKIEKAATASTKKLLIELDRQDKSNAQKDGPKSILYPLISAMVNHPGFKYSKNQLNEVGLYEFMDSVKRISKIQDTQVYSIGRATNIDYSKFDTKQLNWLADLD